MLDKITTEMIKYPGAYSNWGILSLHNINNYYEIAICGELALDKLEEFSNYYLPNTIFCAAKKENDLILLKNRYIKGETLIYICKNNTCKLPVKSVEKAIQLLDQFEVIIEE